MQVSLRLFEKRSWVYPRLMSKLHKLYDRRAATDTFWSASGRRPTSRDHWGRAVQEPLVQKRCFEQRGDSVRFWSGAGTDATWSRVLWIASRTRRTWTAQRGRRLPAAQTETRWRRWEILYGISKQATQQATCVQDWVAGSFLFEANLAQHRVAVTTTSEWCWQEAASTGQWLSITCPQLFEAFLQSAQGSESWSYTEGVRVGASVQMPTQHWQCSSEWASAVLWQELVSGADNDNASSAELEKRGESTQTAWWLASLGALVEAGDCTVRLFFAGTPLRTQRDQRREQDKAHAAADVGRVLRELTQKLGRKFAFKIHVKEARRLVPISPQGLAPPGLPQRQMRLDLRLLRRVVSAPFSLGACIRCVACF